MSKAKERLRFSILKCHELITLLPFKCHLYLVVKEAQGIALQKVEDAESMLESYGRIVNERRADGPTINS